MMIACCIPMLVIAIVLVAIGAVGSGFIFVAVACTAMMALMMRGMNHGGMNHAGHGDTEPEHDGMDQGGTDRSTSRPVSPPSHTVHGRPHD